MSAATDISGRRFGKLVVVERAGSNANGRALWNCLCDCGKSVVVKGNALLSGNTRSCGCLNRPDIAGKRFGRLIAIRIDAGKSNSHSKFWICKCDCGRESSVSRSNLVSGATASCGSKRCRNVRKIHGGSNERLYNVWADMRGRCASPQNINYSRYGGRGIKVCPEWDKSYEAFRDWALATGYDETAPRGQCTIDRIDVNGNYCPENCHWADITTQNRNKRTSRNIKCFGETKTLSEWAAEYGISPETLAKRLDGGMSIETALQTPVRKWVRHYEHD